MYKFQPQALTDEELVKYCDLWLHEDTLPVAAQRELVKRLEKALDALHEQRNK
jgi:hypothetical protein